MRGQDWFPSFTRFMDEIYPNWRRYYDFAPAA